MAVKTFTSGETLTASDTNTYLANAGLVAIVPSSATNGTVSGATTTIGNTVSSVTIDGVFSSTYDNYRIIIANVGASANDALAMQIGTINTGVYYGSWSYALYTATAFNVNPVNAQSSMTIALTNSAAANVFTTFDLANPNKASIKMVTGSYYGRGYAGTFSGEANSATAQTSLKILAGSGTLTGGTITVYGYRK